MRDAHICEECIEHSLWRGIRHRCYRNSAIQTASVAWMLYSHRQRGTWQEAIDAYLVPTEFMKRKFVEGGLPSEKIFVKPNFHEPDPALRSQSDGSAVFVGRLTPEKGIRTLLAAWKKLTNPFVLRIIGDGPLRPEVEALSRNGGSGYVEYLGQQPHARVIEYVKRAAFLVLPSEWYEGFPHVILEAYACGVPIVASRQGTLPDVILDGETGLLHEPGNPVDLASKAQWMNEHPEAVEAMGLKGRAEYDTKYRGERIYQFLLQLYSDLSEGGARQILKGHPRRGPRINEPRMIAGRNV